MNELRGDREGKVAWDNLAFGRFGSQLSVILLDRWVLDNVYRSRSLVD